MARICMTGEWHQAIVVAAGLARLGHTVRGAVGTAEAASRLNSGVPPVHEPGLPELVREGVSAGRLCFTTSLEQALDSAEYVYIAIDTPIDDQDSPELHSIFETAAGVGRVLKNDVVLVVTAQVPVGTCEALQSMVSEASGRRVSVAHVPEFLRLGTAVQSFLQADRFIIGADDDAVAAQVASLYAPLGRPLLRTDVRSAEMAKHASNAFLALSISFANEVADLCEAVGADIDLVTAGMKLDPRIGAHAFLSAGLGFAGGTLGRDLRALQDLGSQHGRATALVDAALAVNRARAHLVVQRLQDVHGELAGLRVAILGMTYKPGTSTMRRSLALQVMRELAAAGVTVSAFDPLARLDDVDQPPPFTRAATPEDACAGVDAAVLITEWEGLAELDLPRVAASMRSPVFIDTRNRLDPGAMAAAGLVHLGIGKGRERAASHGSRRLEEAV